MKATGTLATGLLTTGDSGDVWHKDYTLREPTAGDYFVAERMLAEKLAPHGLSPHATPLMMEAAIAACCVEELGTLKLVTLDMLGRLKPADLNVLTTEVKLLEQGQTLALLGADQEAQGKKPQQAKPPKA